MDKIWLENYPAGVPETIDPDHFASLVDILEQSIEKYGEKTAFVNMDSEMSFKELGLKTRDFAAYLHSTGLKRRRCCGYDAKFAAIPCGVIRYFTSRYDCSERQPTLYSARVKTSAGRFSGKALVILENFAQTYEK